jgi:hypothetical protein
MMGSRLLVLAVAILMTTAVINDLTAQIIQRDAQYWLPAQYNNVFYHTYPDAARSFYAAHFAHFSVYEFAMDASPNHAKRWATLESRVRELIGAPPRFEPPVDVVAPRWTRIAYRAMKAMEWTHHLHEQLYDILADDRVADKRSAGERAIAYYLSNRGAALATRGYGHAFMLYGGSWSGRFPVDHPAMNGILWAFHWHHAAIYEALMETDATERRAELARVLRVFTDSLLLHPPDYMPLTAQIAPTFGAMFPAAAHIFDNLHMLHDVVNDIMIDPELSVSDQGREINRMLEQMLYANQDSVIPPEGEHRHGDTAMPPITIPTRLPDGRWLPQGHPNGKLPEMNHDAPARLEGGA